MHILSIGFFVPDYLIALANALAKTNTVTLFTGKQILASFLLNSRELDAGLPTEQILDATVTLCLVDYPKGHYFRKARMAHELVRRVYSLRPDVIHYQSGSGAWIPLAMPWLRRFPVVATIHDAAPHSGDWFGKVKARFAHFLVTRFVDQVIVHGREQADIMKRTYQIDPGTIHVVPHISQDMYQSDGSQHKACATDTVLFFGRLRAYKGLEVLIQAAPLIAASVPDMRILICGSGEYPIVHEAAAKNPSWFEVHNRFIEVDEVSSFFQRAAIVVLPYLDATQTGVIPIAYRFSCPVVASRVGSIPEIVDDGKTGYLVPPGDERSLADAIIRLLLDNSLREEMGKAAKAKLEQDLSSDTIAAKSIQVYERAIESRKKPANR